MNIQCKNDNYAALYDEMKEVVSITTALKLTSGIVSLLVKSLNLSICEIMVRNARVSTEK